MYFVISFIYFYFLLSLKIPDDYIRLFSFFLSLCEIYFFLIFYFPFPTPSIFHPVTPPFSSPLTPPFSSRLTPPLFSQEGQRKAAYNCDVTYVSNQELGFDFLRDNLALYVTQPYSADHFLACIIVHFSIYLFILFCLFYPFHSCSFIIFFFYAFLTLFFNSLIHQFVYRHTNFFRHSLCIVSHIYLLLHYIFLLFLSFCFSGLLRM